MDLERDTRLQRLGASAGRYRARVPAHWEGLPGMPVGGLVAALALRAAGDTSGLPRPVSVACQFVRPARIGPVDLSVAALHRSERTAALRVSLTQSGASVLEMLAWAAAEEMPGFAVDHASIPEHPGPEGLPSTLEAARSAGIAPPPCWRDVEFRSRFPSPWLPETPREPKAQAWHRFAPAAVYGDPWVDAARLLFLADARAVTPLAFHFGKSPAALPFVALTLALSLRLHRDTRKTDWVMVDARVPTAASGIVQAGIECWSRDGTLLADAMCTQVCRENPAPKETP
jgi:acyl-CoA thioesterase